MNILDLMDRPEMKKAAETRDGGEYHGPCPGCGGDDRFHVWPERHPDKPCTGAYWCRQCGKKGDAIQYLIDFKNMTFPQAAQAVGMDLPDRETTRHRTPVPPRRKPEPSAARVRQVTPPEIPDPARWREKAEALVAWAEARRPDKIQRWLNRRGIKKATADRFRLGWCDGPDGGDFFRPRSTWGLPDVKKTDGKLKKLWIPAGLVIPRLDAAGHPVWLKIRRWSGEAPRYYVIPGSETAYLVIGEPQRAAIVVESELDAMLLAQEVGDLAAVICIGSSRTKPDPAAAAVLDAAAAILVSLDFDPAGKAAARWWLDAYDTARWWPVPAGKDPGDLVPAGVDIREWVVSGLPAGWRLGQSLVGRPDMGGGVVEAADTGGDVAGRPAAVAELARLLDAHRCVSVAVHERGIKIREPRAWARDHWDTSRRISELVFRSEGVMAWLWSLGVDVVDWRNVGVV